MPKHKKTTGFLVKSGEFLISWKSNKQQTISRSSAEAEYRSLPAATTKVTWMLGLFSELKVSVKQPMDLFCYSKAALQIAANPIFYERTKHIEIDCHFVRDKIKERKIVTHHIGTKDQQANMLTKGLGKVQHCFYLASWELLTFYTLQFKGEYWSAW